MRRVLALAPYSRGFGWIVLEGADFLHDWGVAITPFHHDKESTFKKIEALVKQFRSNQIIILDREQPWIPELKDKLGIKKFRVVTRAQIKDRFPKCDNKYEIALKLLEEFPEVENLFPRRRENYQHERDSMKIFDALASLKVVES